jgi:hypothetical protein
MKPPSDRARLLLQRYKEASAPDTEQKARLGDVLRERVLRGDSPRFEVVPVVALAVSQTSFVQKLWASAWAKLGVGVVAAGAAGGAGYRALHEDAPAPMQPAHWASVAQVVPRASVARTAPKLDDSMSSPKEADDGVASKAAPSRTEKAPSAAVFPSAEPTIDEEVKLLSGAQAALRSGESKKALELLAAHAARFPNGKLGTLRQVTHMMALCQAGLRAQARREAADFIASKPSSPFVERVRNICSSGGD